MRKYNGRLTKRSWTLGYGGIITFHCFTLYPKKYAPGFCFAVLCCGYTLTDFPISIRLTSLALWQSDDCPSASKATLINMDKYFMWIHYERLHNHNKAKHNKTMCIFLGIYCTWMWLLVHALTLMLVWVFISNVEGYYILPFMHVSPPVALSPVSLLIGPWEFKWKFE